MRTVRRTHRTAPTGSLARRAAGRRVMPQDRGMGCVIRVGGMGWARAETAGPVKVRFVVSQLHFHCSVKMIAGRWNTTGRPSNVSVLLPATMWPCRLFIRIDSLMAGINAQWGRQNAQRDEAIGRRRLRQDSFAPNSAVTFRASSRSVGWITSQRHLMGIKVCIFIH